MCSLHVWLVGTSKLPKCMHPSIHSFMHACMALLNVGTVRVPPQDPHCRSARSILPPVVVPSVGCISTFCGPPGAALQRDLPDEVRKADRRPTEAGSRGPTLSFLLHVLSRVWVVLDVLGGICFDWDWCSLQQLPSPRVSATYEPVSSCVLSRTYVSIPIRQRNKCMAVGSSRCWVLYYAW